MNFDSLPEQWRAGNAEITSPQLREEALVRVCRIVEKTNATILVRDLIETAAAIAVIPFFGIMALALQSPVSRIGSAIIFFWGIFVVYRLHHARMSGRTRNHDLSLLEYYRQEARSVSRQIAMLRSVLWWYLAPCMIGVNLVYFGQSKSLAASGFYFAVTLVGSAGIWWFNQHTVRKRFLPLQSEIAALLNELNETPNE